MRVPRAAVAAVLAFFVSLGAKAQAQYAAPSDTTRASVLPESVAAAVASAESAAAAESLMAPLDTLAAARPSPAAFLWNALAGSPGSAVLSPRAIAQADPVSAADLLADRALAEIISSGNPAAVPEWYASRGLGPGWIDVRVDGLRTESAHAAAPVLDAVPLETAAASLWVPGPLSVLSGTGGAGGALLARTPDDFSTRAKSVVGASIRYFGSGSGAVSFASPNTSRGFAFHYSDRTSEGRQVYERSWVRSYGGRLSRALGDSLRVSAWGRGLNARTRLFDGTKLERHGRTTAAGIVRSRAGTQLSLAVEGGNESIEVDGPGGGGLTRRRGSDLGGEAGLTAVRGAATLNAAAGLVRSHATWRDSGAAMSNWTSTQSWALALAALRPLPSTGIWIGARWENESGMTRRISPAAAAEWRHGPARVWAALSRGFGEAAYPTSSNDFHTLALQGLGLLNRSTRVELPHVRRAELGAGLGPEEGPRWVRGTLFAANLSRAFIGDSLGLAGIPSGIIADGALDSLRTDARLVGAEISGRFALVYGFYVRGRGGILRDRSGHDAALGVGPARSALGAFGLTRALFKRDLLANAELIGNSRGSVPTPFGELDAATIVSFHLTGDVGRRFHLFYQIDNIFNEVADSRTFVPDVGRIFLPGRNYSLGIIWRLLD